MNILQLTKKFPYPIKDGESSAIVSFAEGYNQLGHRVDLLAFNTRKHHVEHSDDISQNSCYASINSINIDTTPSIIKMFLNLFSSKSYNVERFKSKVFIKKLISLLTEEDYHLVQIETLYMAVYAETIREHSNAKIVYRSHNREDEIWDNLAKSDTSFLRKNYYRLCARRLRSFEKSVINTFDLTALISETDESKYHNLVSPSKSLIALPGIKVSEAIEVNNSSISSIGYIGSLDWRPNIEGLEWFFSEIWTDNNSEIFTELNFKVAGRSASPSFSKFLKNHCDYIGEIDDSQSFIESLDLVIVPLLSGSGIRIKILEAMSMGKVVLSTPKGFEGIPIEHGVNGFMFNNSSDLKQILSQLQSNPNILQKVGTQAQELISNNFSPKASALSIINYFS